MLFAVLFAASNVVGAPRPDWIKLGDRPGDQHLAEYFKLQTALIGDRCLNPLPDRASWEAQRAEYRRQLMEMLGLDPLPERTDLQVTVTGTIETDDFVVEKLYFQSMPRLYVTGNLYRPKELSGRVPAILYVCGHAGVRKEGISYGNKCAYQHHGVRFARLGYVCLVIDSVQLGEIEGIHHGTYRYGMWWWLNRGYTPAGVEAWFGIRALGSDLWGGMSYVRLLVTGGFLLTAKSLALSEAQLRRAIELAPQSVLAHFWYATHTGRWGQTRGVMRSLFLLPTVKEESETVLRLDPTFAPGYALAANLYYEVPALLGGDLDRAERMFRKGLELAPRFTAMRVGLAKTLIRKGQLAEARKELQAVLDKGQTRLVVAG